jgi:hypothetical protein
MYHKLFANSFALEVQTSYTNGQALLTFEHFSGVSVPKSGTPTPC